MRIVITGAGIVSPVGMGVSRFWQAISSGISAVQPTAFTYPGSNGPVEAALVKEDLSSLLPCKQSTWNSTRTTTLALAAAKLALEDARIELATLDLQNVGIAFGTTLACVSLMSSFDRQALARGPRLSDPGIFPDTGFSAPACRISVLLGPRAFNVTLSNGETSVLDAIDYACSFIRAGRAHTVLVGGSEEVCPETVYGFTQLAAKNGHSKSSGTGQDDGSRNGAFGEGAGVLVLESLDHAEGRCARPLAEVLGYASSFDPGRLKNTAVRLQPVASAVSDALEKSGVQAGRVDFVCCGTNAAPALDAVETRLLNRIFGHEHPVRLDLGPLIGSSYSAGGAMKAVTAALALKKGAFPVSAGEAVNGRGPGQAPRTALVTSLAASGANSALVLQKCA